MIFQRPHIVRNNAAGSPRHSILRSHCEGFGFIDDETDADVRKALTEKYKLITPQPKGTGKGDGKDDGKADGKGDGAPADDSCDESACKCEDDGEHDGGLNGGRDSRRLRGTVRQAQLATAATERPQTKSGGASAQRRGRGRQLQERGLPTRRESSPGHPPPSLA